MKQIYDLIIIGAGPIGLEAGLYAAEQGLLCMMSSLFCEVYLEVTHSAIRSRLQTLPVNRSRISKFTAADLITWLFYHRPIDAAGVPCSLT